MLKILRIILALIIIPSAIYSGITGNFSLRPYTMFFLGATGLVMGIFEFKEKRKTAGFLSILFSGFLLLGVFINPFR